ncbi:UDP-2,3-diacetamido-2,3-dideoxy-D-glucuronate 2-epimerase [mine drainage metagenome]|uniref:UDP-2,3-diacetamido-2,3-dideoxy-D-glucuronate 2-epimerase n=1 Tax=mine drainage metagenome TaxID=410659 RepID=A0A1J5Q2P0_9ZZZZ
MRILSVVGARPQFIKVAPIARAMPEGVEHLILHTGQHYDEEMSQVIFDELKIPRPIANLQIGSGSHASQTAALLVALETSFLEIAPDWVLVYGDTNTTIAAALTAAKMNIRLAHLEAGLRSFNRTMPEELNRIVTDHLSDLLLAPSSIAMDNLFAEGLGSKAKLVGDVMVDSVRDAESLNRVLNEEESSEPYLMATLHRAENTDDPERLAKLIEMMASSLLPIRLAAHPRLVAKTNDFGIFLNRGSISVVKPLSYLSMVRLMMRSSGVITDSGGLQKEAFLLGIPCVTLRTETEWLETLEGGWNVLDPNGDLLSNQWWAEKRGAADKAVYGDGQASRRAIEAILNA